MKYLSVLSLLFACLIMTTTATQAATGPIINKALTDSDYTFDQTAGLEKVKDFFVALPGRTTETEYIASAIKAKLLANGFRYQEFMGHTDDLIVIMFTVTNEVRKVDLYTDESGLAQTAEMYRMFVDTAKSLTPDIRDPSKNTLFRRQTVKLPIEALNIQAYVLKSRSLLTKVWEGSAGSVEGTSASLPDLINQAIASFPMCTAEATPSDK